MVKLEGPWVMAMGEDHGCSWNMGIQQGHSPNPPFCEFGPPGGASLVVKCDKKDHEPKTCVDREA